MKLFDKVKVKVPRLNKFDLSHDRKLSCSMGLLFPIAVQEIIPGDKFRWKSEILLRMAPTLAPIMHRIDVKTEFYFVPNRLIWNEWEKFITGGEDGLAAPVAPYYRIREATKASFAKGFLPDYMGLPVIDPAVTVSQELKFSTLPFRAVQTIWNEYYRDQNLTNKNDINLGSGEESAADWAKLEQFNVRCWEKDYFTSALPWAQRGPDVTIPIGVEYMDTSIVKDSGGSFPVGTGVISAQGVTGHMTTAADGDVRVENIDSIAEPTINELRRAFRLQEWLEKNARGGARYIEQILSHFGVISSDARLQRPEFLGGAKQPVMISEVLSSFQSPDDTGLPQGNMAGHGISVGSRNGFSRRFEEHGFVIGFMSIVPRTAYQQGLPKVFSRFDKLDYAWPEFANIGEQEVKLGELYYDPEAVAGRVDQTFGYQSRYAEYKYSNSTVHGEFRDTLSYWHMGRIFESEPALNGNFVGLDPTTRIFAVPSAPDNLYVHVYNKVDALRPLPYYGTPTF